MYSLSALGAVGTSGMYGSSFAGYKGMAADNQQKLYKSLEARLGSQEAMRYTGATKEEAEAAAASPTGTAKDARNFVQQYTRKMTELKTAASDVLNGSKRNIAATSSDTKVLEGAISWQGAAAGNYKIDVKQLASQQVNISNGFTSADANSISSGQFQIATVKNGTSTFEMDKYASYATNAEALSALAKDINSAGLGVTANTVQKDGKTSLVISSDETGESGGFNAQGSFAVSAGLTESATAAQDAKYSVDGKEYSSAGNKIQLDNYKLDVTLKSTGSANLTVGAGVKETTAGVKKLLNAYNSALAYLNDNYAKGSGVIRQMSNMLHLPISDDSLDAVGIKIAKDGTMSLDEAKFEKSLTENPELTNQLVSGSYSLAQGLDKDTTQGLSISSGKLTDGMKAPESQERQAIRAQFGGYTYGYSTYSTLLNYRSMGSLLNTLV